METILMEERSFFLDRPQDGRVNGIGEKQPGVKPVVSGDPLKTEVKPSPNDRPSLRDVLMDFSQSTTLHGLRYICLDGAFLARRLLWLVLFTGCAGVMGYQIIDRIIYYYSWPVTVNVHVNFNASLLFPSVTLCNQNAFRATAATEAGRYRLIEAMYTKSHDFNASQLLAYNATNITLDNLYERAAHRKEDLIVACEWQDKPCSAKNFTQVFTDHGVCYSFNAADDDPLMVTSTGSDYGLKLTLNVEQYEYMPGPHDAAGVKLLLHDRKEFPKVHELGLAIPTGSHAFIGIQLVSIKNLPKPHGDCGVAESEYYKMYSTDACQLTCMTKILNEECGCRHHFMPSVDDTPPICTLDQFYSCYHKIIGDVKLKVRKECGCPIPCFFLIFDPTISFATTSMYATDKLLSSGVENLTTRFMEARETTSRMDRSQFDTFKSMESNAQERLNILKKVMFDEVETNIIEQEQILSSILNDTLASWKTKMHLYRWQEYIVQKNFMRVRQAMEERTFNYLAMGFQEFSYQIESKIKQLANTSISSPDVRQTLHLLTLNELGGRIDLADRAYDNYTQLYGAYYNASPVFRYKYLHEDRNDNIYIGPHVLLRQSLLYSAYAVKYSGRVGKDILRFKRALQDYVDMADKAYYTQTLNTTELHLVNIKFLQRGRTYFFSKATFYFESIDYPLRILRERIAAFEAYHRSFNTHVKEMMDNAASLRFSLNSLKSSIIDNLDGGLGLANNYFKYGNISKLEVARVLTAPNIYEGISSMKIFFQEVRSRGQNVYDGWLDLIQSTTAIWSAILNDEDMLKYYEFKNMTRFLQNISDVAKEIETAYMEYRSSFDFRFLVGTADSTFLKSLEDLMELMTSYLLTSKVDTTFIQENFLQLDIFYRERSYEQITQQVAYDMFALLCDIGGSMGLFVGASVLTMFELVDLLFDQTVFRLSNRRIS
ncbi:uncharacterized protein LOC124253335 isoform X1 [Haliotis rubra]|uniref:uncharacterized protein LOC124253335 isoform X1 n=1 Tax=Haliotis rubra TaxID=36100 RepID=UPI001EE62A31|nr:uncharacterized protein LOC124253335 isoform X1 [Haliotis rubra]